jgi:hypothetical protein
MTQPGVSQRAIAEANAVGDAGAGIVEGRHPGRGTVGASDMAAAHTHGLALQKLQRMEALMAGG